MATVRQQAGQAGIGMPEVAIFDTPDVTGASRNKALVAVSTGLLNHMRREEAEAVLGMRSAMWPMATWLPWH